MLSSGCRRGSLALGSGGGFTPLLLFAGGAQGVWYDPSDFSTLFQDSAATTPVTATGQPVGKILDKSGKANHATQATATKRPLLQQDASGYYYLSFDGVDDFLATGNVDFSATDDMFASAGITKSSDATRAIVVRVNNVSGFQMEGPQTPAIAHFAYRSVGSLTANVVSASAYAAPYSAVVSGVSKISTDTCKVRVNQTEVTSASDQGTGNYPVAPISIGAQSDGTLPFNGRVYSLVVRAAASSASEIALAERWVGARMGIWL